MRSSTDLKKKYPESSYVNQKFKELKLQIVEKNKAAKKEYFKNKIESNINAPRELWKILKLAIFNKISNLHPMKLTLQDGQDTISDPILVADMLNEYFVTSCDPLLKNVIYQSTQTCTEIESSFSLDDTTESEIADLIDGLKSTSAVGLDTISSKFLKFFKENLKGVIARLINNSLRTGRFPDCLKKARVVPIHKSGSKLMPQNYRGISVLCSLSKIYERVVYKRLQSFLDRNSVLHDHQYGFTTNSSTLIACINLTNFLSIEIDKRNYVACIFLDIRKAFDSVDHDILLSKLQSLKFSDKQVSWFRSYLDQRTQLVSVNGVMGKTITVQRGVPQGSILGPILFNIYINDMCKESYVGKIQLYADDAVLKYSSTSLDELFDNMNLDLNLISQWFDRNKLQLNVGKTKFLLFSNKPSLQNLESFKLFYKDQEVERVTEFKYLGLMIDSKLKWDTHLSNIKNKIIPYIFVLKQLKHTIPESTLLMIYNSYILSQILYLNCIWSGCAMYRLNELFILQKRALKHIHNLPVRYSTKLLFSKHEQLDLFTIVRFQLLVNIFKIINGLLKFSDPLPVASDNHSYSTRRRSAFQIPFFSSNSCSNNVIQRALIEFNNLPREIRHEKKFSKFKSDVLQYLLQKFAIPSSNH